MRNVLHLVLVGVFLVTACGQKPSPGVSLPAAAEAAAVEATPLPDQPLNRPPTPTPSLEPDVYPLSSGMAISLDAVDRVGKLHALAGHSPSLAGLAFLAGSGQLVSLSKNFALRQWDVFNGQEVRDPVGDGERVYSVAFSPDGALMATSGGDQTIKLWDVQSGQQVRALPGHGTHLMCMSFSPDGRLLASAGDDALIKIWDVASGQELRTLSGHLTPVTSLAFSPDGALLASGSARYSTIIYVWDVESGQAVHTLVGHTDNVHSLAFSPDGTLLASASLDRSLRLWEVQIGRVVHILREQGDPVYGLAFSPDGALLASSGDGGDLVLWSVQTGEMSRILSGHTSSVLSLAFSPDGSLLASGGLDRAVLLWGIPGASQSASMASPPQPSPSAEATPVLPLASANEAMVRGDSAKDSLLAFSSYRQGESKIYTMKPDGSGVTCLSRTRLRESRPAWSPDGTRIAYVRRISHSNHEIYVMDADGSNVTRLTTRPDSVESQPAWSPDGSRIAFISNERPNLLTFSGRFQVWLMEADGSRQTLLTEIGGANTSPDWSPDGTRIVFDSTRDGDHEIYVINIDGSDPVNLTQHPAHDTSPAWSPDGSRIAFVSDRDGNQEIYVMNADGTGASRLSDSPGFDKDPAWSPDGRYIAFYSRRIPNNTEVYLLDVDDHGQTRLTREANFDGFPAWRPLSLDTAALSASAPAEPPPAQGLDASAMDPLAWNLAPVDEVVSSLQGLSLDQFFEESFKHLMLRDPEWVSAEGLADRFEIDNSQLTDLTDATIRETQELQLAILGMLRQYDRDALSPEQQISYDVYQWYLDDLVRGHRFMYYDYPITHFTTGVQFQLLQLFTDLHPLQSRRDAEDYVRRLSQVNQKFEGLVEGLQLRKEAGVVLPRFLFPWLKGDIRQLAQAQPRRTPLFSAFEEKLGAVEGLGPDERQALLDMAEKAIAESVSPAFAALAEALDDLEPVAPSSVGVSQLPDGRAYYDYVLRHHTTTGLSAEEIHQLGLEELERIHGEMRARFDQLGYPQDAGLPALYARLAQDGGWVSGARVAETYEAILAQAERDLDAAFDIRPEAELRVIAGSEGDYYVSASLDGSRPGAFYARVNGGGQARYGMPTLAYHEGVPGHHFQIALAQESDLPLFRNVILFTGYAEGWALYAEQLARELGWYDDDPHGDLGRLQAQAFRAARLVVDTGLHTKGWTFDQAHDFMVENVGMDPGYMQFEVSRYVAWPGQSTAYMVGMLKIMALRQEAMDRLGDQFDLKEFHHVVLSNGSMPLAVLERVVENYIEATLNR